jgi:hypothetical protein
MNIERNTHDNDSRPMYRGQSTAAPERVRTAGELAQRYEEITVQMQEDDVPTLGIMRLAEQSGAFDFWQEGEDIYSIEDGEPV